MTQHLKAFPTQVPTSVPLPAFFLPAKSISTAAVVITVDLSKPWTVVDSAMTWINRITLALNEQYQALEKRGSPLPAQLKVSSCRHGAGARLLPSNAACPLPSTTRWWSCMLVFE